MKDGVGDRGSGQQERSKTGDVTMLETTKRIKDTLKNLGFVKNTVKAKTNKHGEYSEWEIHLNGNQEEIKTAVANILNPDTQAIFKDDLHFEVSVLESGYTHVSAYHYVGNRVWFRDDMDPVRITDYAAADRAQAEYKAGTNRSEEEVAAEVQQAHVDLENKLKAHTHTEADNVVVIAYAPQAVIGVDHPDFKMGTLSQCKENARILRQAGFRVWIQGAEAAHTIEDAEEDVAQAETDADVPELSAEVDLNEYPVVLVNTSAGKDSMTIIERVATLAKVQNYTGRLVAVHADLGKADWPGTLDLARKQAEMAGYEFFVVRRQIEGQEEMLDQIEMRGMWPDNKNRYCTSDWKRDQIAKLVTQLTKDHKATGATHTRVLNVMGMRAEESPARAKKNPFTQNNRWTTKTRTVFDWLPIHHWKLEDVWNNIHRSGMPYHYAYDLGMSRLSCVFCVFASHSDLMTAAQANPDLLKEYAAAEKRMGHTFRKNFEIASLVAQANQVAQAELQNEGQNCNDDLMGIEDADAVETTEGDTEMTRTEHDAIVGTLPDFSAKVYTWIVREGLYEPYFSDIMVADIAEGVGATKDQVKGAMKHLNEVGLTFYEDWDGNNDLRTFVHAVANDNGWELADAQAEAAQEGAQAHAESGIYGVVDTFLSYPEMIERFNQLVKAGLQVEKEVDDNGVWTIYEFIPAKEDTQVDGWYTVEIEGEYGPFKVATPLAAIWEAIDMAVKAGEYERADLVQFGTPKTWIIARPSTEEEVAQCEEMEAELEAWADLATPLPDPEREVYLLTDGEELFDVLELTADQAEELNQAARQHTDGNVTWVRETPELKAKFQKADLATTQVATDAWVKAQEAAMDAAQWTEDVPGQVDMAGPKNAPLPWCIAERSKRHAYPVVLDADGNEVAQVYGETWAEAEALAHVIIAAMAK